MAHLTFHKKIDKYMWKKILSSTGYKMYKQQVGTKATYFQKFSTILDLVVAQVKPL